MLIVFVFTFDKFYSALGGYGVSLDPRMELTALNVGVRLVLMSFVFGIRLEDSQRNQSVGFLNGFLIALSEGVFFVVLCKGTDIFLGIRY